MKPLISLAGLLMLAACTSQSGGQPAANPLEGSEWRLVNLSGEAVAEDQRATLAFSSNTSVSGSGGCNNFVGGVAVGEERITFGNLASTRKACIGPAMELEEGYLAVLSRAARYDVEEGALVLYAADGTLLARYRPITQ
jgi:heat shock protein HslJ